MQKAESLELANYLKTDKYENLTELLSEMYGSCDSFGLNSDDSRVIEKDLKKQAENLLLELTE